LEASVQVRPIPPKLQRAIHAKAIKGGKFSFQELMVWKLAYGLENPRLTEAEARKLTERLTLHTIRPIVDRIDELSGTDEHLREADQPHAVRKFTEPLTMATAWLGRFPDVVPSGARDRQSHGPRPVHRRGSRRGERAKSSSSDDPDPEPPRVCRCGCGESISHLAAQARYLNETHRKRAQRARDKANPDRVVEREREAGVVAGLPKPCRCAAQAAYPHDHRWVCCACGRPKAGFHSEVNGHLATREFLEILADEARRGTHTPLLRREWRTRPSRKMAAELRKTRCVVEGVVA
jgi:hypothetical protein